MGGRVGNNASGSAIVVRRTTFDLLLPDLCCPDLRAGLRCTALARSTGRAFAAFSTRAVRRSARRLRASISLRAEARSRARSMTFLCSCSHA